MNLTKPATAILLAVMAGLPCSVAAQEPSPIEYGSSADLAGVTRIFIDTGEDMDDHDNIARIITKKLAGLTVTSRVQDAEVILVFRSSEDTHYAGTIASGRSETAAEVHANTARSASGSSTTTASGYSAAVYETISAGGGKVFRYADDGSIRMIMSFKGAKRKGSIWKKPRTKFAEKFVEMYREGNPEVKDGHD